MRSEVDLNLTATGNPQSSEGWRKPYLPDVGLVVRGPGQHMRAVRGEARADVEGAVDVARKGCERLRGRPQRVEQVVPAIAAAGEEAAACAQT